MTNKKIESCDSPPLPPESQPFQDFSGRLVLLRRRKSCPSCGRVHGPPQARCESIEERSQPPRSDDLHLPWTFS